MEAILAILSLSLAAGILTMCVVVLRATKNMQNPLLSVEPDVRPRGRPPGPNPPGSLTGLNISPHVVKLLQKRKDWVTWEEIVHVLKNKHHIEGYTVQAWNGYRKTTGKKMNIEMRRATLRGRGSFYSFRIHPEASPEAAPISLVGSTASSKEGLGS